MEHSRSPRRGSFERRSSVPRRTPSPSPILSPTSRSYTPSPPPSRGRPQTSRLPSRSKSRGRLSSRSRSRSSSRSRRSKRSGDNSHHHGLFKTTAGLLAGIGVAAVVAHKVWPKGVLYGDHEDWEHEQPSKHRHSGRQHRRRRSVDNGERVVERRTQRHGDAVYYEEVSRRRPQNYERIPRPEHERVREPVERLPYPPDDHYAPGQPVYTERRRTVVQPVPVHSERRLD
ncbi:hypothetical protein F53441_3504 [Fusarium austroafricanum]|uniref:Uncharacterized protein n=1 Tax=Fusarium austroafricanum TaxID=2364996 RepID=A0A8H4KQQ0_9HYPO|nr:hypothetical protein F53441_3504 [Fusarium austroafricanum]